jgi:ribosomal protein S18 acetylase RimI-like enzyme
MASRLFVAAAFQRQGIGTEVIKHVISEAAGAGQAVTLGVVKTNPALRLYERLGFRITHEDDRMFYMRRDSAAPLPATGAGTHARGKS